MLTTAVISPGSSGGSLALGGKPSHVTSSFGRIDWSSIMTGRQLGEDESSFLEESPCDKMTTSCNDFREVFAPDDEKDSL